MSEPIRHRHLTSTQIRIYKEEPAPFDEHEAAPNRCAY